MVTRSKLGQRKRALALAQVVALWLSQPLLQQLVHVYAWGWVERKGVGCILSLNAGLDFSQYFFYSPSDHLITVMFSSLINPSSWSFQSTIFCVLCHLSFLLLNFLYLCWIQKLNLVLILILLLILSFSHGQ